jgi:radical SAM protein (TIGR01212 family)
MVVAGQRYRKLNTFLREAFGQKIYRVGLRGGFTCPNRDGSVGDDGCLFCNPASNEPLGHTPGTPVREQLASGIEYVRGRHGVEKFIAFFSDYTATYAGVDHVESLFREAISHPDVVGLALGTRPDCLSPQMLDLLEALARVTFLWVELGIQSAREESLESIGRRHSVDDSRRAIAALREREIAVSGHVILGLPGEGMDDMIGTARFLAQTGVHGAKIHNLHVIEDTRLAEIYRAGEYRTLELDEYVELAARFLEQLPPQIIIQRVSGEAPRRLTVAPDWSVNKLAVKNAVGRGLESRDTWQGRGLGYSPGDLRAPVELPGLATNRAR